MARSARDAQLSRRSWLLAGCALCVSRASGAQRLSVIWDGDNLHVSAPQLHFLTGKPLERLKDGATVTYLSQLTLSLDNFRTAVRRVGERFAISYDVWEEKFSATRMGGEQQSASHLDAPRAESWCLNSLAISSSGVPSDRPFWLRLELRAADPRESLDVLGDAGINLTRLIEIFSRQPGAQQPHWTLEAGPLRLAEIKRIGGRASRSG